MTRTRNAARLSYSVRALAAALLCCSFWPYAAVADQTGVQTLDEIVVFGRAPNLIGSASSASEGLVGYDDIRLAPMLRVGELVETVPATSIHYS